VLERLALLPLHSLQRLVIQKTEESVVYLELPSCCPRLRDRWYNPEQYNEAPTRLSRALANLGRCPAWQQSGPDVCVSLYDVNGLLSKGWTQDLCDQILAPLSVLSSKQVQLSIDAWRLTAGSAVVKATGRVVGSSLVELELLGHSLSQGFWPAVWAHLPGLQQLTLSLSPGQTQGADITSFCKLATHPLQLTLEEGMCQDVGGISKLQMLGTPVVTVTTFNRWEYARPLQ
jgi:hypothetical protein